jgi:serine/threonine-protein kinase
VAVKPGDILHERYRIDALIGRGGMGQVFAATDLRASPRVQVAIKVVSRLLVDEVMMARLQREAEAARRIRSEFVPHVYEVADTADGETYLVMERLLGEPLSQRIRGSGALPWPEVARAGEDVLRGLIDAHAAGIIHRDLKPSNVFLALKAGRVRAMILDFGVCKMPGLDRERLTATGESIGTVAYMAPEQIRGASRVDERADLYAFGVLVFEMLSGRLPHEGPSQMAILASKLENPAARLRECAVVDVPVGLDELIERSLARDPGARFATATELLAAWQHVAKRERLIAASTPPPPRAGPDDVTGNVNDVTERSAPRKLPPTPLPPIPLMPTLAAIRSHDPAEPPSGNELVANDADMAETEDDLAATAQHAQALSSMEIEIVADEPTPRDDIAVTGPIFARTTAADTNGTQTSLTAHAASRPSGPPDGKGGGSRIALVLAAFALVAGIAVVGISFSRGQKPADKPTVTANDVAASDSAPTSPAALPTAAAASASATPEPELASSVSVTAPIDSSDASFELPPDPTHEAPPVSGGNVRPRAPSLSPRPHPARPPAPVTAPPTAPKATVHGITNEPRY